MNIEVTYHNTKTGEHEQYSTTLDGLVEEFNGIFNQEIVKEFLENCGAVTLEIGQATTTIKEVKE